MNVEKQVVNAQVKTGIGGMVISPHAPHAHWTNGHMVLSGPQRSGPAPTWQKTPYFRVFHARVGKPLHLGTYDVGPLWFVRLGCLELQVVICLQFISTTRMVMSPDSERRNNAQSGKKIPSVFPTGAKTRLRELFIELYKAIIDFQAQSVLRFFRSRFSTFVRDIAKWDSWEEMIQKFKGLVRDVDERSQEMNSNATKAALDELVQITRESEEDKCLQALRRGDYVWYKERVQNRVSDTCSWFLNHESYQSWDPDQNTIELALCALVHQLLCLRPQLMRHALARYKQDGAKLADNVTALWNILESASADPEAGTVLIVLDGLDECRQDERNMETLSRFIHEHFQKGRPKSLKILLTSRPYQGTIHDIQKLEDSFPNIRIKGEDDPETISEEINAVIEHHVGHLKLDTTLKKHLEERLKGTKHRTYLWLYLVLDRLKSTPFKQTSGGIDFVIQALPATVNEAYEKILSRSKNRTKARKAVLILLAAYRPLTLREMQIAVDLNIDTQGDLDMESDENFKESLREWCGLFIAVHDKRVYFLHQTAREFLLPIAVCLSGPPITRTWAHMLDIYQAHAVLAESSSYFGHKGVVRVLLDTGKVDVDAKDGDGLTPLSWAAAGGHKTVVRRPHEFIHNRVRLSRFFEPAEIDGLDNESGRVLHVERNSRIWDPGLAAGRFTALKKRFATYHPTPNPRLSLLKYLRTFERNNTRGNDEDRDIVNLTKSVDDGGPARFAEW
ncbi:hypothetical protein OOU_Y34scaffold01189g3 [Pyricularia oryzae Y34]|uniref:NWD NACHT-NTPase N-terminal domain-containing protein n=1 Tax=Pyricularia oryzae (strain Y34) TaxID=1143189 RepID=A0AA97NLF6_PYRO3|nr:hypothetical protein OOU_Y34scaffold01189g3 [Pyricularia oryzae Y34]